MNHEAECQLLEEGARSYVSAVNAILAFRALVQARCRGVVENRWTDYGNALGVTLAKDQVIDWETPAHSWHGRGATLGTVIHSVSPGVRLHHVLCWDYEQGPALSVCVYASLNQRRRLERLWEAFSPSSQDLWRDDKDWVIGLSEEVTSDEIGVFENKLAHLLTPWIELWQYAGGVKVLSPAPDQAEDQAE